MLTHTRTHTYTHTYTHTHICKCAWAPCNIISSWSQPFVTHKQEVFHILDQLHHDDTAEVYDGLPSWLLYGYEWMASMIVLFPLSSPLLLPTSFIIVVFWVCLCSFIIRILHVVHCVEFVHTYTPTHTHITYRLTCFDWIVAVECHAFSCSVASGVRLVSIEHCIAHHLLDRRHQVWSLSSPSSSPSSSSSSPSSLLSSSSNQS